VRAVSLQLKMHNTDDVELYKATAGIQLIEKVSSSGAYGSANSRSALTPTQLFKDPTRDATAVNVALRTLVLTPEELDALLNPKPPEPEQKGKKKRK